MEQELKFGIVGAGRISQSYVQAFEKCQGAKLAAVADIQVEARQAVAEKVHCQSYERYEDMTEDCELDAVIVCTPPVTHPDICIHFMDSKIHVLCEKPLCIDLPEAYRMYDAARRNGVLLTMASKFRYVEDVIRAKSMVVSGVLGELVLCENVFASRVDMTNRWNSKAEISGGGVLIDNGTHSVDLMRYFLGPLSEMHVLEGKRTQGLDVDETVSLFVRSVGGVIGTIDLSWSINKERASYIDIYGSNGAIAIGWKESRYLDYAKKEWAVFGSGYNRIEAFRKQIENFSGAIRGEQALFVTEEDALSSVNVVGLAYQALQQNQWMPVPTPLKRLNGEKVALQSWSAV